MHLINGAHSATAEANPPAGKGNADGHAVAEFTVKGLVELFNELAVNPPLCTLIRVFPIKIHAVQTIFLHKSYDIFNQRIHMIREGLRCYLIIARAKDRGCDAHVRFDIAHIENLMQRRNLPAEIVCAVTDMDAAFRRPIHTVEEDDFINHLKIAGIGFHRLIGFLVLRAVFTIGRLHLMYLVCDFPGLIEINAFIGRDAQGFVELFRRNVINLHLLQAEGARLLMHNKAHPLCGNRVKGAETIGFNAIALEEIDPFTVFICLQSKRFHAGGQFAQHHRIEGDRLREL